MWQADGPVEIPAGSFAGVQAMMDRDAAVVAVDQNSAGPGNGQALNGKSAEVGFYKLDLKQNTQCIRRFVFLYSEDFC